MCINAAFVVWNILDNGISTCSSICRITHHVHNAFFYLMSMYPVFPSIFSLEVLRSPSIAFILDVIVSLRWCWRIPSALMPTARHIKSRVYLFASICHKPPHKLTYKPSRAKVPIAVSQCVWKATEKRSLRKRKKPAAGESWHPNNYSAALGKWSKRAKFCFCIFLPDNFYSIEYLLNFSCTNYP